MFEGFQVLRDAPMRDYTTLKLGGPADYMALPASGEETAALLAEARGMGMPVTILGHGSNVLVLDGGIRGLVIRMGRGMNRAEVDGNRITARAGTMMGTVAALAADHGLTGLEFASGIPGTVGGGVLMNAGAYGGEMSQVVRQVTGVTPGGEIQTLEGDALAFGYRHSALQENGMVVTGVTFELSEGKPEEIREKMADLNSRRAASQPLDVPSAGSAFKRPQGAYAAALIDQCGLKGYAVGGARVSPKHAGFLVNTGDSAKDFLELMKTVQRIVEERTGIRLEPEIRIMGEAEA